MKLTRLQKHYRQYFKEQHNYTRVFNNISKNNIRHDKPSAVLKKLLQCNNMKLIQSYSFDNHRPQAQKVQNRIEIAFNVNNIPFIFSILKSGYIAFNMNIKCIKQYNYEALKDHFAVSYNTDYNQYSSWAFYEDGTKEVDKDYQDLLLKELQEEEMFQYSLIYKNLHIHQVLTKATTDISKNKNYTFVQIINELQKVIECLKKSENNYSKPIA